MCFLIYMYLKMKYIRYDNTCTNSPTPLPFPEKISYNEIEHNDDLIVQYRTLPFASMTASALPV